MRQSGGVVAGCALPPRGTQQRGALGPSPQFQPSCSRKPGSIAGRGQAGVVNPRLAVVARAIDAAAQTHGAATRAALRQREALRRVL